MNKKPSTTINKTIDDFLNGKSAHTVDLYRYFIAQYKRIGKVDFLPAKTMIGIATSRKRIAYITQLGKNFIHIVFPFSKPYHDNLCFQKIAQVPGQDKQFNHHLRLYDKEDITDEVYSFMKLAYEEGL